jgi:hypothetical protein
MVGDFVDLVDQLLSDVAEVVVEVLLAEKVMVGLFFELDASLLPQH